MLGIIGGHLDLEQELYVIVLGAGPAHDSHAEVVDAATPRFDVDVGIVPKPLQCLGVITFLARALSLDLSARNPLYT